MTNEMTRAQRDEAIQDGVVGAVMGQMAKHGVSFEMAHARALAAQEARRQDWLASVIDPLAKKHGTTREVILSVLFCDTEFNEPTTKDAYWAEGSRFAAATLLEAGLMPRPIGHQRGCVELMSR